MVIATQQSAHAAQTTAQAMLQQKSHNGGVIRVEGLKMPSYSGAIS